MPYCRKERQREIRAAEREYAAIRFVCSKCGGEFTAPESSIPVKRTERARIRAFVRLGGGTVCEVCAAERFKRRRNPWGENPDAIR